MSIPYVVRKKADLSSGERKELWYTPVRDKDLLRKVPIA